MALTEAEVRRIERLLEEMDYYEEQKVLSSWETFFNWLASESRSLARKIERAIADWWESEYGEIFRKTVFEKILEFDLNQLFNAISGF